jgi:hypothetical protein
LVGQQAEPKRRPTRANRIVPVGDLGAPGQQNRRLHVCFAGQEMVLADPDEPTGQFDEIPQWCADFVEAFDTLVERGPTTGDIALSVLDDVD